MLLNSLVSGGFDSLIFAYSQLAMFGLENAIRKAMVAAVALD
jgi:hypothetical protein